MGAFKTLCPHCGQGFNKDDEMQAHLSRHTGLKSHKCQCGKQYAHKSHLTRHMKVCKENATVNCVKCNICYKMFKTKEYLKVHVTNVHSNPGSFQCANCGRRFNHNATLLKHTTGKKCN